MSSKPRLTLDTSEKSRDDSLDLLLPKYFTEVTIPKTSKPSYSRLQIAIVIGSFALNILLACRLAVVEVQLGRQNSNLFWTPFNSRLRYHVQRFTSGFGHSISQWQGGPSPEKDELWEGLYVESFALPKSEAQRLANKTIPISDDPESEYMTSFSVFHYLHCLDMMRRVTEHMYFPEYYNLNTTHNQITGLQSIEGFEEHGMYSHEHIDHCFDSLRQALTCAPDLGPVVWQWNRKDQRVEVFAETVHTCANWDELLDFARERRYDGDFVHDKQLEPAGQCSIYDEDCGFKAV